MVTIMLVVVFVLVVVVIALVARIDQYQNMIANRESLIDQWIAYAESLESDIVNLQNSLYAYHAAHANGNRDQLPLVISKAKLPIVDRYVTRGGREIVEEKPKTESKVESKKTDSKPKTESKPTNNTIISETESLLGTTLTDAEKQRISVWESSKGKSDCAEYVKRIKGMRKNSK